MKKVEFKEEEVLVGGSTYGELKFDEDQNAWILWPNDIDDGVTYFEDLKETQDTIKEELEDWEEEEMVNTDMGDYDLTQVSENEFEIEYHQNAQGRNRTIFLTDEEVETVESLLAEIEKTEDSDEKFEKIDYLERTFF